MDKVNIFEKLDLFNDYFSPRIVAELNGQAVKLVKIKGEFPWHKHDNEDEMFYVIKGAFDMEYRESTVHLKENEFIIVQKGKEHRPVANEETWIMLFEPAGTLNTGDVRNQMTKDNPERI